MSEKSTNYKKNFADIPQLIRILSLDVVLGTAGGGLLACKMLDVHPPLSWWIVLPATVWLIYTCDHLLDSIKVKENAQTNRHLFHYRYRKILIFLLVIIGISVFVTSLLVFNRVTIYFGLITGIAVLLYLVLISYLGRQIIPKEMFVALVYTIGIWGVPVIMKDFLLNLSQWLSLGIFCGMAMLNLLVFSWYEMEIDIKSGFNSFATLSGKLKSKVIIRYLFFFVFILIFLMILFSQNDISYIIGGLFLVMNSILWAVFAYPKIFGKYERYRKFGDGIFLIQFVLLGF